MKSIQETKEIIKKIKPILQDKFNVKNIGVFGSYIREEQRNESDIDILVEFYVPIGFFAFFDLEKYLEERLGSEVDLVTKNALKPGIGQQILKEVSYL